MPSSFERAMGQNPNRTPSEHPNPLKWVVHLPQNGIGAKAVLTTTTLQGHHWVFASNACYMSMSLPTSPLKLVSSSIGGALGCWAVFVAACSRALCFVFVCCFSFSERRLGVSPVFFQGFVVFGVTLFRWVSKGKPKRTSNLRPPKKEPRRGIV